MDVLTVIIISCSIIFLSTVIGSSLVFFVKKNLSEKASNIILGLASGVMIAAGIFGLLIPAMEEAELIYKDYSIIPVVFGFILVFISPDTKFDKGYTVPSVRTACTPDMLLKSNLA